MRTHTQLKIFFAGVLIALATLTIVTAPQQVMGAGQSKSAAVVVLPQDSREAALALRPALPGTGSAEGVGVSRMRTHDARALTPDNSLSFLPPIPYDSGGSGYAIAIADVNGDGKLDVIVAEAALSSGSCCVGTVAVLLGNGDGTFKAGTTYSSGGAWAVSVAVADVNRDGKLDAVVANCAPVWFNYCWNGSSSIGVLLGNGDGTFQPVVNYDSGAYGADSVAVADVNGDGNPDLAVANSLSFKVGVLLGNGDGTFQPAVTYDTSDTNGAAVAVADVNGDGKPDLVVANWCSAASRCGTGGLDVLLGNGDGTFQASRSYDSGGYGADSLTVVDLNSDARLDLVVTNYCASATNCSPSKGSIGVLLGNGDGTFQPVVTYDPGGDLETAAAVADVNGDGKPDLLVANYGSGTVGALLGNGDGTLKPVVTYNAGGPSSVIVADVNGDGRPDLVVTNPFSPNLSVLLNNSGAPPTTTLLVSSANPARTNHTITYTATVKAQSGGTVTGTVTFQDGGSTVAAVVLSGNQAAYTTSYKTTGTHLMVASYSGDLQNTGSTSPSLTESIFNGYASTTALTSSLNPSTYGQKVTWTATVTSSGSVRPTGTIRFTWTGHTIGSAILNSSGVATLSRSNLNADSYPLTAVYAGDSSNLGSTSAVLNQLVLQTTSAATLTSSPNPSTQGQAVTFTATITSPTVTPKGPVTFTSGKTVLGTAQLSAGKTKLTISSLPEGRTRVTVTYYGSSNIAKSAASLTQTVQQ